MTNLDEMYEANRRMWDERVAVHLAPGGYDLAPLRAGRGRLAAIEERELPELFGPLAGRRVLHLQCHFGEDSLILAQRGGTVVGVDFSPAAIAAARSLAEELGLGSRASFVHCNVYDAPAALAGEAPFDLVYSTWGTIGWLPDIERWAAVAAGFLAPGGLLYLADGHPAALVFDDAAPGQGDQPGWFAPYFETEALVLDDVEDYANRAAKLEHQRNYAWMHGLGRIASAMLDQGLQIVALREHDALPWRMFRNHVQGPDRLYRWPNEPWLPLAFTLAARRPATP
jgi:SAM-dependent methyltransferase